MSQIIPAVIFSKKQEVHGQNRIHRGKKAGYHVWEISKNKAAKVGLQKLHKLELLDANF